VPKPCSAHARSLHLAKSCCTKAAGNDDTEVCENRQSQLFEKVTHQSSGLEVFVLFADARWAL
jgi:hypothetical protein